MKVQSIEEIMKNRKGQTAVEYLILLAMTLAIVSGSFGGLMVLLNKPGPEMGFAERFFCKVAVGILGTRPGHPDESADYSCGN